MFFELNKNFTFKLIPMDVGVYLFKDKQGNILYVGKAKQLRRRLVSYFKSKAQLSAKTIAMLNHAVYLDIISTTTEKEALLLEASLIKKHSPRYNIILRDDKQYIIFSLDKNKPFPGLAITRPHKKSTDINKILFGPFSSSQAAKETWKILHKLFPLRRCTDRAFANRIRPCLYYHLKKCLAPCTKQVSVKEYEVLVRRTELFLQGRSPELLNELKVQMQQASLALEFELAAALRDQIKAITQTIEKQVVILPEKIDLDVLGLAQTEKGLSLSVVFIRQGAVLDTDSFFWTGLSLAEATEVIQAFLLQFYTLLSPLGYIPSKILLPWNLNELNSSELSLNENITFEINQFKANLLVLEQLLSEQKNSPVQIIMPKNQIEEQLVNLAVANAKAGANKNSEIFITELLQKALSLRKAPQRIEVVDVSHSSGQETRVGLVVFEEGRAKKDAYRIYKFSDLSEISGGDDYGILRVWLFRRLESGEPFPDLLLIDGGRGQLAVIEKALSEANASDFFEIAAITKAKSESGRPDRRAGNVADRIFRPGRINPLPLKAGSTELLFLQRIRDAAHDYALGKHRQARNKVAFKAELLRLPGIGEKTARLLWANFNSLSEMKAATLVRLVAIVGIGKLKAEKIQTALQQLSC